MIEVEIIRLEQGLNGTFGVVRVAGQALCVCLELPWMDNRRDVSCIPAGEYSARPRESARFGETYEVLDVPGRTDILIHAGNTVKDTEGCILAGSAFGAVGGVRGVTGSRAALARLLDALGGERARVVVREV